jgi:hypothetical protein
MMKAKKRKVVSTVELESGDKVIVPVTEGEALLCVVTVKYVGGYWRCVPVTTTGKLQTKKAMVVSEVELVPVKHWTPYC